MPTTQNTLPDDIDALKALVLAERLRMAIAEYEFIGIKGEKLKVTMSFGVATFPEDGEDDETLIGNADIALYGCKEGGRNCVSGYGEMKQGAA